MKKEYYGLAGPAFRPKFAVGDLVRAKKRWGNDWKEGIGYVYDTGNGDLCVGLSLKDGGCSNELLEDLADVEKVDL